MAGKKELILAILAIGAGFLNARLWQEALREGASRGISFYSWPALALFVFTVLFALAAAFIRKKRIRIPTAVLSLSLAYLLIPYQPFLLGALALTAAAAWYAGESIAIEHLAAAFFSVRKIFRSGLPIFFTGLAISIAMFYFADLSPNPESISLMPKALFDAAMPLVKGQVQKFMPGFSPDAPVDDLIFSIISRQPEAAAVDLSRLPAPEREALIREARESFSKELGMELSGRENSAEALYKISNAQIAKFAGPAAPYLPILAAFGFFIAVKALTIPIYWLSLILIAAVVKFLLAIGFLRERTEATEVKRLTL